MKPKLLNVVALEDYKLLLTFETKEIRLFDVSPYIEGDWFSQLWNVEYFKTVKSFGWGAEWANGQDLSHYEMYNKSIKVGKEL